MTAWLDKGIPRGDTGLWDSPPDFFQFADWSVPIACRLQAIADRIRLDPAAPPENAAKAMTDPALVADAYLVHVTAVVASIAGTLGNDKDKKRYTEDHARLRTAFQKEYITPSGRLASDAQTAFALALEFKLLNPEQVDRAMERLVRLVTKNGFKIGTGFAGTNIILKVLAENDQLEVAYRMLQEKNCPSWLYPITMGATTVWERWDSLLPDGSINVGCPLAFLVIIG